MIKYWRIIVDDDFKIANLEIGEKYIAIWNLYMNNIILPGTYEVDNGKIILEDVINEDGSVDKTSFRLICELKNFYLEITNYDPDKGTAHFLVKYYTEYGRYNYLKITPRTKVFMLDKMLLSIHRFDDLIMDMMQFQKDLEQELMEVIDEEASE